MIYLMNMGINMRKFMLLKILGIILVFTACDQNIYHEVYINNNSSYDLNLYYEIFENDKLDSLILEPGNEHLIHSYSKVIDYAELYMNLKYIRLSYKDSLIYEQNPIDQRLWVYNHPGYYFTIVDSNMSVVGD